MSETSAAAAWQQFEHGLGMAVADSAGDSDMFLFFLMAPMAAMVHEGWIGQEVGGEVIKLLHAASQGAFEE
ncbi:MAG: hypothetical protein COX57_12940 [Alphaproteobacteria bacterium CG_4_10_14_0_2_um_filter_63_37]|nr:MAG: hypothetical protein AUJ55_04755 [Proteobacteria bacterium CG1_02_64_396]PJA23613.1 MAG: hypothetical protein COX57_12940 [Alphaproteobacteria bacterium CG_4_10_14_0_2_um_filter_63_37]